MDTIKDSLEKVQTMVKDMQKKSRYKKANKATNAATELQYDLMKCRGQMEICAKDFRRAIRNQSESVQEGIREHRDTLVQEQSLWDAAMGYMLVKDAIYALKTVNSYDSVAHAYEILDAAMKQISGNRTDLSKFFKIGAGKKRNEYGFVTSKAAVKEKEELLNSFFEELKKTGDIDVCYQNAVTASERAEERRGPVVDMRRKAVEDLPDDVDIKDLDDMKGYSASGD